MIYIVTDNATGRELQRMQEFSMDLGFSVFKEHGKQQQFKPSDELVPYYMHTHGGVPQRIGVLGEGMCIYTDANMRGTQLIALDGQRYARLGQMTDAKTRQPITGVRLLGAALKELAEHGATNQKVLNRYINARDAQTRR